MDNHRGEGRRKWVMEHGLSAVPSMKRRMATHDYCGKCMYMITLCVADRQPLLGSLRGADDNHGNPWVEMSEQGIIVKQQWQRLPQIFPQVRPLWLQIMPDHLHCILLVTDRLPRPLGHVVSYFKARCTAAIREISSPVPPINNHPLVKKSPSGEPSPLVEKSRSGEPSLSGEKSRYGEPQSCLNHNTSPSLWEPGFNDRILKGNGQLSRWVNYLKDNPRRLWVKRYHRDWFTAHHGITIGSSSVTVMGNIFLLDWPLKVQVQCSRRLSEPEIHQLGDEVMAQAACGAVVVSPCISPGEKAVMKRVFEAGYPQIVLLENGFAPMAKPYGRQFDACAEGRLLLVAPWEHHNEHRTITRSQCLALNALAAAIVQG